MLILALVVDLAHGRVNDVVSASALRTDLARYAHSPPTPELREAWVRYADRTGDTLPVGVVLATLAPTTLTDAERALLLYDRARRAAWSEDASQALAGAYAADGRPDAAEAVASRVDEASEAYPATLALRADGELADEAIAEGLGHMLALDGPPT